MITILFIVNITLVIIIFIIKYQDERRIDAEVFKAQKFFSMFQVTDRWLEAKLEGRSMEKCLLDSGYSTVAIYGLHYIGECLVKELKDTQIKILYGVDQNIGYEKFNLKMYKPDDDLPAVDLIIVTPTIYFYEIKKKMMQKVNCPVISISEIVERMI